MMYDIDWDGRSTVYDDGHELRIIARSVKLSENIFGVIFMSIWVAFVMLFLLIPLSGLVEWILAPPDADTEEFFFQNPLACGTCFFFLIPFVMLLFGGNQLGWMLFGKETLIVQPARITHRIGWWIFKRERSYEADRIKDILVKEDVVAASWKGFSSGHTPKNARLQIVHGMVGVSFFGTIGDAVELEHLAERIRERLGLVSTEGVSDTLV